MEAERLTPSRGEAASSALVVATFLLAAVACWSYLVVRLGWTTGLLVGWFVAPIAALAAASLALLWTVPLRGSNILSLTPRRLRDPIAETDLGAARAALTVSVIVPAFNAERYLVKSLPPLMTMLEQGAVQQVIIVDDGSTDGSADYARSLGATVIASGGRRGPGGARNVAALQARGDILWFVDADVVVHADSIDHLRANFTPGVVAVFGSYDDRPAAGNFGSQYKNLVHHHYHQHANPNASTFWSGCGAVRRDAFAAEGGFDAERYRAPSIEDIDLGYRLRAAGGLITLDPQMRSTHLKVWSIPELIRTDVLKRAVPWTRMMLRRDEVIDDLNVGTFERLRAVLAGVTVMMVALAAAALIPGWLLIPLIATVVTANWHLFRLFKGQRGLLFGVGGLVFHQVYYLYSAAAFVWCWIEWKVWPQRHTTAPAAASRDLP